VKFLADECVDRQIVERLRRERHEVLYFVEMEPGISDDEVRNLANLEKSILLTADKDFGELIFRQGKSENFTTTQMPRKHFYASVQEVNEIEVHQRRNEEWMQLSRESLYGLLINRNIH
jgi:predicted nuclease of predicted toxin-antitoxin system